MTDQELYDDSLRRPWVYISGPMIGKRGDSPWLNCRTGMQVAHRAWKCGWHPIVPQMNGTWELTCGALDEGSPDGIGGWLEYDFSNITRCDAVFRLPGESKGADREVAIANENGIQVFFLGADLEIPDASVMRFDGRAGLFLSRDLQVIGRWTQA